MRPIDPGLQAARPEPARDFALGSFDYEYPRDAVATSPASPRDHARLMVLDRASGRTAHRLFRDLPELLSPGDCVVLNSSRVRPARLIGRKPTGGKAELLLLRELEPGLWSALSPDLRPGLRIALEGGLEAAAESRNDGGEWLCRFSSPEIRGYLARHGLPPLPPYILRKRRGDPGAGSTAAPAPEDAERYQTVYAKQEGSVAAPTAGLHFTLPLIERLRDRGVSVAELTLHVGHGTFQPLTAPDVREHRMKAEWFRMDAPCRDAVESARGKGRRIVAVGTSVTRSLETWASSGATEGWTDLYIHPGRPFRSLDALITNFHLPRSAPLVLACAFAGKGRLLSAYREAVPAGYRLYSYGDAMIVL